MQYSIIKADARFLAVGDETSTKLSDTNCDRLAHKGYLKALGICFANDGTWQIMGTYAYMDIADDTYKYHLDDIVWVDTVEFKVNSTDTKYTRSTQIDPAILGEDLENYTPNSAQHDIRGDYLLLFKADDFEATTDGIKLRIKDFPTAMSDDTDTPKLPEPFHDFISTYIAWQYNVAKQKWDKARELKAILFGKSPETKDGGIKKDLLNYMANRGESRPARMIPEEEIYGRNDY